MISIGVYHQLKIIKEVDFGIYLDSEEEGPYREILLPLRYVPKGVKVGDTLNVFVYKDSLNRPIATTQKPKIQLNGFASLEVMDINKYGAFLDWGVENQLLLPYREQPERIEIGKKYVVMLYLDRVSDRLVATTRIEKHLAKILDENDPLKEMDEVELLIYGISDLGFKAVVNQKYSGMLYKNDVFRKISSGDSLTGYIKHIREDRKIDLTLRKTGLDEIQENKDKILNKLKQNKGILYLHDGSSPEEIKRILEMSKKTFKKAVGMLYKEGTIELDTVSIRLKTTKSL